MKKKLRKLGVEENVLNMIKAFMKNLETTSYTNLKDLKLCP